MKKYTYLLSLLILSSCGITKQASKNKQDIQSTETIKTQIKRKGDTLRIEIPKITYKDTTIVKTNYINRTEARITYDSKGNASVDCISAEIDQFREEVRTLIDQSKYKESSKKEEFNPQYIIYAIALLAFVLVIGLFILGRMQANTSKALIDIASKLVKI